MQILTSKLSITLIISLALIFALSITNSIAQQKTDIAGKMTCAVTKQEIINVGDTKGHTISLTEYEGTNVSTAKHEFMDGAQIINVAFNDLIKGNGVHQTYIRFAKRDDTIFAKCEGKTTTILSPEGTPIMTFEGTWSYIKGTGIFENIQGSGTYKGKYISKNIFTAEWKGEYFIKK